MNMCKQKKGANVVQGRLYTCDWDNEVRICVSAGDAQLIMVRLSDGHLTSRLSSNCGTGDRVCYTDVTDQYCLSKV